MWYKKNKKINYGLVSLWLKLLYLEDPVELTHPFFSSNIQNSFKPKPQELGSWYFDRMFTPHCVSHVMYHVSHVTCHISCLIFSYFFPSHFWEKIEELHRNCLQVLPYCRSPDLLIPNSPTNKNHAKRRYT